jgi:hypothetical protein
LEKGWRCGADRAAAERELFGDLVVRAAASDQLKHLTITC